MEAMRYRVVLTGKILDGHQTERVVELLAKLFKQPPDKVARFFGGRPLPLPQEFDQATAGKVRERILAAGAHCTIEPLAAPAPSLSLEDPLAPAAAEPEALPSFQCPKCGHPQDPAESCIHCGIIFAKYRARTEQEAHATAAAPPPAGPDQLAELYIGPRADYYLERFPRFRAAGLSLSWNWSAFFGSFIWALYRKLWLWATVMLFVSLIPVVNLLAAFLFPTLANYLYFRHVEGETKRLQRLKREPDQIAGAGGVSRLAAGIASGLVVLGLVMVLSVVRIGMDFAQGMQEMTLQDTNDDSIEARQTRATLGTVMMSVAILKMTDQELAGLSLDELQEKLKLRDDQLEDGWGQRIALSMEPQRIEVTSAGPDRTFDTDDDICLSSPL